MIELSVVICTHNPRPHYLSRVLESLRNQTLSMQWWELLLIDNASKSPLASAWDISWHPKARHVLEGELGLSAARQRGIREASGALLLFVDDDNVLSSNYLSDVVRISSEWPFLGAWGSGSILPEFELQPSEYVRRLVPYLALRETAVARWGNVSPNVEMTPWGAGLCIRAKVATAYRQYCGQAGVLISGRKGGSLLSGDDVEICYVARDIGFGMGIFPELKVIHLIPKERVSADYLVKMYEGTERSNLLLGYKWRGDSPRSPFSILGLLSIAKNVVRHQGIDRRMYFARLRAMIAARRVIAASQKGVSAASSQV
jgi:glycosyltransferase involved in cell wall biosynthesis